MRARTLLFVFTFFFSLVVLDAPSAQAATEVSGTIASSTEWVIAASPYVVTEDLTIGSDATLTIDAGVVVKIAGTKNITILGALDASGTMAAPVTFTSSADDTAGGDTNGDGGAAISSDFPWGQVRIAVGATARFIYADLRYGGMPPAHTSGGGGAVFLAPLDGVIENSGTLEFNDSTIEQGIFSGGIYSNGILNFSHSKIHDVYTDTALDIYGTAIIAKSVFGAGEDINADVDMVTGASADLTFSGTKVVDPIILSGSMVHDGGGNTAPLVLDWVNLATDTIFPAGPFVNTGLDVSVDSGETLTISSGAVVKFSGGIDVSGTLVVGSADSDATTTLTSATDSSLGGDTNEGDNAAPAPGDWWGVLAEEGSSVTIRHAFIAYAGSPKQCGYGVCYGQVTNLGGDVAISDSVFATSTYRQIAQMGGTTSVERSNIVKGPLFAQVSGGNLSVHDSSIAGVTDGIQNNTAVDVDATDNWWGAASGPQNADTNPDGTGASVSAHVLVTPWRTTDPFAAPEAPRVSNVMFLPGIEGSRLYEGTGCGKSAEELLWEPVEGVGQDALPGIMLGAGDTKVAELALDADGKSVCPDIYTKDGDIIGAAGGSNVYASLMNEMEDLKQGGTIHDWEPVAYDWRLSLDDLLTEGAEHKGKIYYDEATSTPYIEQTLRSLAASSKTGKVTIVAHSNGGLLAKALLHKLGDTDAAKLVDKVILVAAPQSGAPSDVGSLLVGYGAGLYSNIGKMENVITVVSNKAARTFTQDSPMAYHLLPSEDYLESTMGDPAHPVVSFSGDAYAKEEAAYGATIANRAALDEFLLAKEGGRSQADDADLLSAKILSPALIEYANSEHASLDAWVPPAGIEVDQIAGWGVDTVAGINFYTVPGQAVSAVAASPVRMYRPLFVEDGDGTVTTPSALMIASSTQVKRYWLDLYSYNYDTHTTENHGTLFEVPQLGFFIKGLIESSTSTPPEYVLSAEPASRDTTKKLTFFLHSPLTLQLTDSSGAVTGIAHDGTVSESIPGSTYGEFGEVKYVTVPEGGSYNLSMQGQGSGTFALDLQESAGGTVVTTSSFVGVPVTEGTLASMNISDGVGTASPLMVDEHGDGGDVITLAPEAGGVVQYVPPAAAPDPAAHESSPASPGSISIPVVSAAAPNPLPGMVPIAAGTTTPRLATTSVSVVSALSPAATTSVAVVASSMRRAVAIAPGPATQHRAASVPALAVHDMVPAARLGESGVAAVAQAVSAQPLLTQIVDSLYTGLHMMWSALTRLF